MHYPFTEAELSAAAAGWGCNCGPSALAFALQVKLDAVRPALPLFQAKRYTNPAMMQGALMYFGQRWREVRSSRTSLPAFELDEMFDSSPALVRVQWCGPWTEPGANPKWAYRQTHWICTYLDDYKNALVFDCNGGINTFAMWCSDIVPFITSHIRLADGRWFPTHIWRLEGRCSPDGSAG